MERERWDGTTLFRRGHVLNNGTITIQRVQSFRNLVTIEELGQGKVIFDRDGSFQGCWAMGDKIFDVSGRAQDDRTSWNGRFEIRRVDGHIVVIGSFRAKKTHD